MVRISPMDQRGVRSGVGLTARRVALFTPVVAVAAVCALWAPSGLSAASVVSPTGATVAITPGMTTLPGSLHPRARPEFDVGRVDPGMHLSGMSLLFRMSPVQEALEKRTLANVQDPASASYHQWLTPEQYAAMFGASPADIARATAWLKAQGLSVDGPSRTATRLGFSGTVTQIEQAFRTEMHRYHVDGENHFAMSRAPSVPSDLTDVVLGLHGLHDFRAPAPRQGAQPQYVLPIPQPDGGTVSFPVLAPADFAKIYDIDSLYAAKITGAGQSIAVAEQSDFNDADIAAFRATFGLPDRSPLRVLVPNTGAASVSASLFEVELDLEWSGAVAPDATVTSVFTGNAPNNNALDALVYAIDQRVASVLSTSFVYCEDLFTPADVAFAEGYGDTAALEGMTVLVAAGDTGAGGCDSQSALAAKYGEMVEFPASLPSFVAVGGTQFQLTPSNQSTYLNAQLSANSYIPESAWNETLGDIDAGYGGLGAGGGGVSRLFQKPYWQVPDTPQDGFRDVPDVALSSSSDILPYAVSMSWTAADGDSQAPQPQALTAFGGTSVAAPALAGIMALLNQAVTDANPGAPVGVGNANPILYALANSAGAGDVYHDVTTGDNIVPCEPGSPDCPSNPPYQFGYTAAQGYDQVTGLGSIDVANLVARWTALTPTSTTLNVTASGTMAGSPLQLVATVVSRATVDTMTGSVSFYLVAPGDGGVAVSRTLGTSQVTASTSSGLEGGMASLTAMAPGGLNGVQVGASYGGDAHFLASWSSWSTVDSGSTLATCPVVNSADGAPAPPAACGADAGEAGSALPPSELDATADVHAVDGSDEPGSRPTDDSGCSCYAAGADRLGRARGSAAAVFLGIALARRRLSHRYRRQQGRRKPRRCLDKPIPRRLRTGMK